MVPAVVFSVQCSVLCWPNGLAAVGSGGDSQRLSIALQCIALHSTISKQKYLVLVFGFIHLITTPHHIPGSALTLMFTNCWIGLEWIGLE